jgi:phage tail-like protein
VKPNAKINLPYRNFKFRVYFEGKSEPVALMSKMTPLKRTTEIVEWIQRGKSDTVRKIPGKINYEPITLKQGLSLDSDFEQWADRINKWRDTDLAQKDNEFRKELKVQVLDPNGEVVLKYKMHKCCVSEYSAIHDIDAKGNSIAIETLKIEHEGCERKS